jgi:uncharacterized protein
MSVPYEPHRTSARETQIEYLIVGFLAAAILEAEVAVALVAPIMGVILHGAVIVAIANIYLFIPSIPHRRALIPLLLFPILRLLSVTIPIAVLPRIYWYPAIGLPWLLSALIVVWFLRPSLDTLQIHGWRHGEILRQGIFGLTGIALAFLVFFLAPAKPIVADGNWRSLVLGGLFLTVFSGFSEEFVFRFLVQSQLESVFGRAGIIIAAMLGAALYIPTLSLPLVAFWMIAGMIFGFWVHRTRSLWGVVLAHSLINVGSILLLPLLIH